MKKNKYIMLAIVVILAVAVVLGGCSKPAPAPAPAPTPAPAPSTNDSPLAGLMVKPDGTKYKYAVAYLFLGCDWMVNAEGIAKSLIDRADGEYIRNDCNVNADDQIAFVEDLATLKNADALLIQPVDEEMLGPSCDKCAAAGIPVIAWDIAVNTDTLLSTVLFDWDGDAGSNLVGEYFVERAHAENRQINVYEVWGMRSQENSQSRHRGFWAGVNNDPMVNIIESPDCNWSDEVASTLVMDAFTAQPELNGVFVHGGGSTGAIEGLNSIGKLVPLDDPNHIIVAVNDLDKRVVEGIDAGEVDACATNSPWPNIDISFKLAGLSVILGEDVPNKVIVPAVVITSDNIDSKELFGALVAYPRMPVGQWDLWPILDTSSIGVATPTK